MSNETKRKLSWMAVISGITFFSITLFTLGFRQTAPAFEIRLVAREMAFFVEGGNQPNPDLYIPPGQKVLLTFINQDRGLDHDVVFPDWGVKTKKISFGGQTQISFKIPSGGETFYLCSFHPAMMKGRVLPKPDQ